jgi:hypothetical protein
MVCGSNYEETIDIVSPEAWGLDRQVGRERTSDHPLSLRVKVYPPNFRLNCPNDHLHFISQTCI